MIKEYKPSEIEKKWQEKAIFKSENKIEGKENYYVLEMFDYPSGKLHVGHLRNYAIGPAIARQKRMQGFNVLHPFGWDSFGLPAENAAIDNGAHPGQWTKANIDNMRRQLKRFSSQIIYVFPLVEVNFILDFDYEGNNENIVKN